VYPGFATGTFQHIACGTAGASTGHQRRRRALRGRRQDAAELLRSALKWH